MCIVRGVAGVRFVMCYFVVCLVLFFFFFFQAEDGIRDTSVTGVQTCALPIFCLGTKGSNCFLFRNGWFTCFSV